MNDNLGLAGAGGFHLHCAPLSSSRGTLTPTPTAVGTITAPRTTITEVFAHAKTTARRSDTCGPDTDDGAGPPISSRKKNIA